MLFISTIRDLTTLKDPLMNFWWKFTNSKKTYIFLIYFGFTHSLIIIILAGFILILYYFIIILRYNISLT